MVHYSIITICCTHTNTTKMSTTCKRRYWFFSAEGSFFINHWNNFSSKSSDTDTFQDKDTSWAVALSNSKNSIYHSLSLASVHGFLKREKRQTAAGNGWHLISSTDGDRGGAGETQNKYSLSSVPYSLSAHSECKGHYLDLMWVAGATQA